MNTTGINREGVTVRSVLWQKLFASFLFVLLTGIALMLLAALAFPEQFPNDSIQQASRQTKTLYGAFAICVFAAGLYIWWCTMSFVLRADAAGITQSNGFRRVHVPWGAVASYTWEAVGGTRDHLVEPVLRDVHHRVIFRPFAHPLISTASVICQRAEFWHIVTERLDGRLVQHTP